MAVEVVTTTSFGIERRPTHKITSIFSQESCIGSMRTSMHSNGYLKYATLDFMRIKTLMIQRTRVSHLNCLLHWKSNIYRIGIWDISTYNLHEYKHQFSQMDVYTDIHDIVRFPQNYMHDNLNRGLRHLAISFFRCTQTSSHICSSLSENQIESLLAHLSKLYLITDGIVHRNHEKIDGLE